MVVAIEVLVRRAARDDLAGVMVLSAQLAPMWTEDQVVPVVTKHHERVWEAMIVDERRVVLVAEHDGGVVGIADLVVVTSLLEETISPPRAGMMNIDHSLRDRNLKLANDAPGRAEMSAAAVQADQSEGEHGQDEYRRGDGEGDADRVSTAAGLDRSGRCGRA
jgi:hypothetical protein